MELQEHIINCATPLKETAQGYTCTFIFPSSFPGFDGHFPGNPVLPGVIQILQGELSSLEILNKEFSNEKLMLASVTRCKFLRPIKPDEEMTLNFSIKTKPQKHISICALTVGNELAASYQLIFSPEEK